MRFELLLWLIRSGAFLLAAIYFIKTGYWPRRVGTDPHCRRCEYNLAQAVSERCPECGASIAPKSIRVGQRIRVAWRTGVGLVCLVIALASLGFGARSLLNRGKLQRVLPASALVWNLSDPDESVATSALLELSSRWEYGQLDRKSLDAVIEHGIRALESRRDARVPPGVHVLGTLIRKKTVSPEQWQQIAQAGAQVEFAMPEFAEVGSTFPARFDFDSRLPTFYVYLDTLQYDDLPPHQFADLRLLADNWRIFPNVEFDTSGQHVLRWQIRREHKQWNATASRHELTMPSMITTHSVRIDVLEQDEYEARLASALSQALEFVNVQADKPRGLQVDFRVTHRLPVPIEIEVLAERGEPPVAVGVKQIKPGSAGVFSIFGSFRGIQPDTLNLTLRLYKYNRRSEAKGPALPDREFRFANCEVLHRKRRRRS